MIFTSDLGLPEAPLLMPDGSWLVAELAFDRGRITRVSGDGTQHSVAVETGRPNGLALDAAGAVWACETLTPALLRLDARSGAVETVLRDVDGVPLLWPNDLCFGPDGALYMTDSGLLVRDFLDDRGRPVPDCESLPMDGKLIRYDPPSGRAEILDAGFQFTNGIAFGPDGMLYVNETITGNVYRYSLGRGGALSSREVFGNVFDPEWPGSGLRGPDGMAFSRDGRLFVAVFGQGDVTVLGPDGATVERMRLEGRAPTNVAFGRDGEQRLYVVEDEFGTIEVYDVGVDGLALHT
jgi:gluconolactonase